MSKPANGAAQAVAILILAAQADEDRCLVTKQEDD